MTLSTDAAREWNLAENATPRASEPTLSRAPQARGVPRETRYRALDLWRGVACLMIVIFHAAFFRIEQDRSRNATIHPVLSLLQQFYLGVPLFFIISGYCITATALASIRRGDRPSEYFKRRFRRIYPPYWAAIAIVATIALLASQVKGLWPLMNQLKGVVHPSSMTWSDWLGNLTLTDTWLHHFVGKRSEMLVGQAWTLCYEEQFYLVCGLVLCFAPGRYFSCLLAVTLISFGLCVAHDRFKVAVPLQGFFYDLQWLYFAGGVLIFHHLHVAPARLRPWTISFLIALALCGLYKRIEWMTTVGVFALLLIAMHPWDIAVSTARVLRPFAFCGRMCYSMYLTHIIVTNTVSHGFYELGLRSVWSTVLVTIPVATALSVLVAWQFHMAVERHFLNVSPPATGSVSVGDPARVQG